jgi:hypothetical protein
MAGAKGRTVAAAAVVLTIGATSAAAAASNLGDAAGATGVAPRTTPRARVVHVSYTEPKVVTHVSDLGPGCPPFAGRLIERRHLVMTGYERGERARVSTVADATIRLVPDDPSAVSYRGTYRELQIGTFTNNGHRTVRSSTFTLGHVRGADGTSFRTVEEARIWHDRDGHVHRADSFHC